MDTQETMQVYFTLYEIFNKNYHFYVNLNSLLLHYKIIDLSYRVCDLKGGGPWADATLHRIQLIEIKMTLSVGSPDPPAAVYGAQKPGGEFDYGAPYI